MLIEVVNILKISYMLNETQNFSNLKLIKQVLKKENLILLVALIVKKAWFFYLHERQYVW